MHNHNIIYRDLKVLLLAIKCSFGYWRSCKTCRFWTFKI